MADSNISVGNQFDVPSWRWVDTEDQGDLVKGDTCGIDYQGKVTVEQIMGDAAFVRYTTALDTAGTPCESDALFRVTLGELAQFQPQADLRRKDEALQNETLAKILAGEPRLPSSGGKYHKWQTITYSGGWQWVDEASQAVKTKAGHGASCGIESDGELTVLGFNEQGTSALVQYDTLLSTVGTRCDSGIRFFIDTTQDAITPLRSAW